MTFDQEEFMEWVVDRDDPIQASTLFNEFPDFPRGNLAGVTCPISNGEMAYYQHDLQQAARGQVATD